MNIQNITFGYHNDFQISVSGITKEALANIENLQPQIIEALKTYLNKQMPVDFKLCDTIVNDYMVEGAFEDIGEIPGVQEGLAQENPQLIFNSIPQGDLNEWIELIAEELEPGNFIIN